MSLMTTKTARTIVYLGCIGGLLAINSVAVTTIWNSVVAEDNQEQELSFLEGAGVTAFAFVVVSALRHSQRPSGDFLQPFRRYQTSATPPQPCAPTTTLRERCSQLTPEQKAALKRELIERCGCTEQDVSSVANKLPTS